MDARAPAGDTSFWLDVADRVIKFLALLVGAAWTWMHYQRSRVYAKKLELELEGRVFFNDGLYLETEMGLKNLGAARHPVQGRGTSLSVWAILRDTSEVPILGAAVFEMDDWIQPGESIHDAKVFAIDLPFDRMIWLKLTLDVEAGDREWTSLFQSKDEPEGSEGSANLGLSFRL